MVKPMAMKKGASNGPGRNVIAITVLLVVTPSSGVRSDAALAKSRWPMSWTVLFNPPTTLKRYLHRRTQLNVSGSSNHRIKS